ncbi:MAG: DUF3108 domain-containing protein [Bacteroidales bacterium]|nr:DUF3108 domain-containing protein [Bacteroidales bacterium]
MSQIDQKVGQSAPVPSDTIAEFAYSTEKMYKWVCDLNGDWESVVIVEFKTTGKCTILTICPEFDGVPLNDSFEIINIGNNEIVRTAINGTRFPDPYPIMRFPFKAGDSWEWKNRYLPKSRFWVTCIGIERVKVPAGTFNCIHLRPTSIIDGERRVTDFWYARNIGLIKYTDENHVKMLVSHGLPK